MFVSDSLFEFFFKSKILVKIAFPVYMFMNISRSSFMSKIQLELNFYKPKIYSIYL